MPPRLGRNPTLSFGYPGKSKPIRGVTTFLVSSIITRIVANLPLIHENDDSTGGDDWRKALARLTSRIQRSKITKSANIEIWLERVEPFLRWDWPDEYVDILLFIFCLLQF